MIPSRPFSGWRVSYLTRPLVAVLLLVMVGSVGICHLVGNVSADQEDIVQMSPGTNAHALGAPASIVKLDYPKSSVMQNVTGEISLNLTLTEDVSSIAIYVPPEFSFLEPGTTGVWTSITNDYRDISIVRLSATDDIGPSWWKVSVVNLTIPMGSYAVRMFNIRAPDICGRYFVKVFIDGESIGSGNFPTVVVKCGLDPAYISGRVLNGRGEQHGFPVNASGKVIAQGTTAQGKTVMAQAYFNASANGAYTIYGLAPGTYNLNASAAGFAPTSMDGTVTVYPGQSLEGLDIYVNPGPKIFAIISSKCGEDFVPWGYVRNSSIGQTPRPISVELTDSDGKKKATVIDETDPSLAFYHFSFNGSIESDGHVPQDYAGFVSGLESGDYYLNAFVNGYLQKDVIAVHVSDYLRSISVPFDLWRSGWFDVTVFFVDSEGGGPAPIERNGTLTLRAYALDGTLSGSNSTAVPEGSLAWRIEVTGVLSSRRGYGLPSGTYMIEARFSGYMQTALPRATIGEGCSASTLNLQIVRGGVLEVTLRSVNWETPIQEVSWEYPDARIRLEVIDWLGYVYVGTATQEADAAVTIANVTGLPPGTYLLRAFTPGYIQTNDYYVSVSFGGISGMTMNLVKTAKIEMTLVFKTAGIVAPIDTYRYDLSQVPLRIEVYDALGTLVGGDATYVALGESNSTAEVVGFQSYAGNPSTRWANFYDTTDGRLQKDYGLPAGTYLIRVWVPGYVQAESTWVSTSLHVASLHVTFSLDRLAHVYGSIHGLDMYENSIPLSWANVTAYGPILAATSSLDGFYEMWLVGGTYTLAASSLGYETQGTEINVSLAWETPVDFDLRPPGG